MAMAINSAGMLDLDFLVPSALVDPSLASELLRDQTLPALARIASRAGSIETFELPPHASPTAWQATIFGVESNVAELWAMACGLAPSADGRRFLAEPAHFKVANDHLRLDDPHDLDVTLAEARALATAIAPVLAEAGWRLAPIEPATLRHWMLLRDDEAPLSAAAIDRAIGDNVAAWQPRAPDAQGDPAAALSWRRCVNEIQMMWFGDPVNEARDALGKPTINTLWLSGNGAPRPAMPQYAAIDSSLTLLTALAIAPDARRSLESFDGFIAPARHEDWSGWREQLALLEGRLVEVLRLQATGSVGAVTLFLCGRDGAKILRFGRRDLGRFWRDWQRAPALAELFGEGSAA